MLTAIVAFAVAAAGDDDDDDDGSKPRVAVAGLGEMALREEEKGDSVMTELVRRFNGRQVEVSRGEKARPDKERLPNVMMGEARGVEVPDRIGVVDEVALAVDAAIEDDDNDDDEEEVEEVVVVLLVVMGNDEKKSSNDEMMSVTGVSGVRNS